MNHSHRSVIQLLFVQSFLLISIVSYAQKSEPYFEDLSVLRPKVSSVSVQKKDTVIQKKSNGPSTQTVNAKVDAIVDSINRFNLSRKYIDGFTIQIYSGLKEKEALTQKTRVEEFMPNMTATVRYQQPKFQVLAGKYFSTVEAQLNLLVIKKEFPTAILVPEKVLMK